MVLRQLLHKDPIGISYLLGCVGKSSGVVVDPMGDIETYIKASLDVGVRIKYVIDTHIHADHISSARALAEAANAEYVLSEHANVTFPFKPVKNGDVLEVGNVTVEVMAAPGHTPESIVLIVRDKTRSNEPWFILSGHTLMAGDLGRTELATDARDGAKVLFETVKKLQQFPDSVEILPGAYAGSVCGRSLSGKPWSTIGFERKFNTAFSITDEKQFIEFMTKEIPPAPPEARTFRAINSGLEGTK